MTEQIKPKRKSKLTYIGLSSAIIVTIIICVVIVQNIGQTGADKIGDAAVNVELTTDKTTYSQGDTIQFSINVENPQDCAVPQQSQIYLTVKADNGSYGVTQSQHFTFAIDSVPTFEPESKVLLQSIPWKVGETMESGSYTAYVTFSGTVDYGTSATCTFTVK